MACMSTLRKVAPCIIGAAASHLPGASTSPLPFRSEIAKLNTDPDLHLAALGRLRQVLAERRDIFNLYELMGEMEQAIQRATAERIRALGSAGRG